MMLDILTVISNVIRVLTMIACLPQATYLRTPPNTPHGPQRNARQTGAPVIDAVEPPRQTLKDIYTSSARLRHPTFAPRNAFQIVFLGGCPLPPGTGNEDLEAWLAGRLRREVSKHGTVEAVMQSAQRKLDDPTMIVTYGVRFNGSLCPGCTADTISQV